MAVICSNCFTEANQGDAFCQYCGSKLEEVSESVEETKESHRPVKSDRPVRKEYKVLTQKDKWFSGKFNPQLLEDALNAYAQQGWKVVSSATADFPGGFSGSRQEMVVILERDC